MIGLFGNLIAAEFRDILIHPSGCIFGLEYDFADSSAMVKD